MLRACSVSCRRLLRYTQFPLAASGGRVLFPRQPALFSRSALVRSSSSSSPSNVSSSSTDISSAYGSVLQELLVINRERKIRLLGIETTQRLIDSMGGGWDDKAYSTVHVAGTNGKGSVCTKLAAAFQAQGLKVGLFTSPHISSFRERIRVNGEAITEEAVVELLPPLFASCAANDIPATFFELTTALALRYFTVSNVDVAIIEVGLGGRLDSTNIISPVLSVITSIDLEHTEFLGNSVESIAYEKCGIIKRHTPVVVGPHVPRHVVRKVSESQQAPLLEINDTFTDFDHENQKVARTAFALAAPLFHMARAKRQASSPTSPPSESPLPLSQHQIALAMAAKPPCRFQELDVDVSGGGRVRCVLDVAHNPQGFDRLVKSINMKYPDTPIRGVVGLSKGKDVGGCLRAAFARFTHLHIVQADSPRAAPVDELVDAIQQQELLKDTSCSLSPLIDNGDVFKTVQHALTQTTPLPASPSSEPSEILVICGSFFIMRDARLALGTNDPLDPFDLNERMPHKTPVALPKQ